ncbi:MAG: PepSY domain-containing protein [Burkholderiales bacterium]|nr:PepSY domain-containing protein [Burkholderiales bacterium]MDE1928974.1 PepSY domain-containing protein [Burkholderiales bacterium]MDE2161378.1 PepSY domain-containing protein [Burkholderiales bacterium]
MNLGKTFFITLAAAGAPGLALAARAFDGQQYLHEAKIALEQARRIALEQVPGGSVTAQELEHERGGSGLRYSFDIRLGQVKREVGIDAATGRVLENSVEGKNPD